jgi:hypothetical protein
MEVMTAAETVLLITAGCAAFLVLAWCAALALSSWASGWRRLAKAFGSQSLVAGAPARLLSARVGLVEYNGILNADAGDLGLALVPMRMFRPSHPPLFIPWTEMETELLADTLSSGVRLTFPSVRGVRLQVSGRTLALVQPCLGRARSARTRSSR